MRVVSTHDILIDNSCRMCSLNHDQHGVSLPLNLSKYGGVLSDPEYVRMVAPQFEPRKKVANLCVRLRASEQINARVVTNRWTLLWLSGSFFGNIRFRERWDPTYAKKTLLPRSDGPLSSSELGEYPTYIIRLSQIFVWEMHHKSTILEILSELSEDPT